MDIVYIRPLGADESFFERILDMKYVVILGDGMSDEPIEALGGRTPLEAANIPTMDALASCGELGIDLTHALHVPGAATSTYLFIAGPDSDMALALSDMDIYEHVTPAYLQSHI